MVLVISGTIIQLYNTYKIPLPKEINKQALKYDKLSPNEGSLVAEFYWTYTPEGHDFWESINEAQSTKEIWNIWKQKYTEPRKQPTLNDIFTL